MLLHALLYFLTSPRLLTFGTTAVIFLSWLIAHAYWSHFVVQVALILFKHKFLILKLMLLPPYLFLTSPGNFCPITLPSIPSAIDFTAVLFWQFEAVAPVVAHTLPVITDQWYAERARRRVSQTKKTVTFIRWNCASRPIRSLQAATVKMSKDHWGTR